MFVCVVYVVFVYVVCVYFVSGSCAFVCVCVFGLFLLILFRRLFNYRRQCYMLVIAFLSYLIFFMYMLRILFPKHSSRRNARLFQPVLFVLKCVNTYLNFRKFWKLLCNCFLGPSCICCNFLVPSLSFSCICAYSHINLSLVFGPILLTFSASSLILDL